MRYTIFLLLFVCAVMSCSKSEPSLSAPPPTTTDTSLPPEVDTFFTYHILQGKNYAEENEYLICSLKRLHFEALFDSSCIYTSTLPENQSDINKLFGFSDSMTEHHTNSARFGWNWKDGALHIHAYCYVSKKRIYKELGTVPLNKKSDYRIEVLPGKYIFSLNGKRDTLPRSSMDTIAAGYTLVPYFGGDEPAPHDMRIQVRLLQ